MGFSSTGRPQGAAGSGKSRHEIKIPLIVRWAVAGKSNVEIGKMLQMSPQGVANIKNTPEYKKAEVDYISGHIQKLDEELDYHVESIRSEARSGVPVALQGLIEVAAQRKDLKAAIEASKELLDRDPDQTLVKQAAAKLVGNEASIAPGLPQTMLDALTLAGNATAKTYITAATTPSKESN